MDLNTLLFIARKGRDGRPQASKKLQNDPPGSCYNCGSYDHWARDCPSPRQPRPSQANPTILALARYCLECRIKHLVMVYPHNLDHKGKAPLNLIKIVPSPKTTPTPSGEESEGVKPLNVVTQAQKLNNLGINEETKIEKTSRNSWKA